MANGDVLFDMTGPDDPEEWIGTRVELYADRCHVRRQAVGGVRLRDPNKPTKLQRKSERRAVLNFPPNEHFVSKQTRVRRAPGRFYPGLVHELLRICSAYGSRSQKRKKRNGSGYLGKKELIAEVRKIFPNATVLPNEDNKNQAS